MNNKEKVNILKLSLSKVIKKLCNGKAPTTIAAEYGISTSTISLILRAQKDPQLSTFIKLSEALGKEPWSVLEMVMKDTPQSFRMTED